MFVGKRELVQDEFGNIYEIPDGFWHSKTGYIVKWVVFLILFFGVFAWIVAGYIHARSRMRKGLRPLAYHRWLIPRSQRAQFEPHDHFTFYQTQPGYQVYGMQNHPEPPPLYNGDMPPQYAPPSGATKADPVQNFGAMHQGAEGHGFNSASNEPQLPPRAKTRVARVTDALRFLGERRSK
ncbi:hypothetical protein EJ05DRAFT_148936 [Pseudovirgaria hyperparasitica]|uniref:Ubiquitin-protein ligase sel1 n=1 Tax=Pseudovirgaria hyperparasitica TaxID=470096 RepID=A0A6A6VW78_9PEZI|nr:uncharacterized protein EJ05DRAFT_148936 [Pseudovirgaria hyperparasitica]KAF2754109.1 hypothetical protein EJ05DRAFT_148936 [Pseudovirgaria hyperparasitica]